MADTWALIANPQAGSGRRRASNARRNIAERAVAALRAGGREVSLHFTQGPHHAENLARSLVDNGCRRLVICGGDGTVNQVLPALVHRNVDLGLVPSGTGNDFARALGIPRHWRAAVRTLTTGAPQTFDLGRVGQRYFCTVAAFGFDAQVSQSVSDRRHRGGIRGWGTGTFAYLRAALQQLSRYKPPRVRLTGEFGEREGRYLLIATANTSSYGGGLRIAPTANPRDGRFEVCTVDAVSVATLISVLPRLFRGGHVRHPAVSILRSSWLRIEPCEPGILHVDGELAGKAPATLECVPMALSVVVPTAVSPS